MASPIPPTTFGPPGLAQPGDPRLKDPRYVGANRRALLMAAGARHKARLEQPPAALPPAAPFGGAPPAPPAGVMPPQPPALPPALPQGVPQRPMPGIAEHTPGRILGQPPGVAAPPPTPGPLGGPGGVGGPGMPPGMPPRIMPPQPVPGGGVAPSGGGAPGGPMGGPMNQNLVQRRALQRMPPGGGPQIV